MARLATLTAVAPPGRYGALMLRRRHRQRFIEKPPGDHALINGGFFVLHPDVLDRITSDDTPWETEPLESLARDGELRAYRHDGLLAADGHAARQEHAGGPVVIRQRATGKSGRTDGHRPCRRTELNRRGDAARPGLDPGFLARATRSVTGHTGFKGGWACIMAASVGGRIDRTGSGRQRNRTCSNRLVSATSCTRTSPISAMHRPLRVWWTRCGRSSCCIWRHSRWSDGPSPNRPRASRST